MYSSVLIMLIGLLSYRVPQSDGRKVSKTESCQKCSTCLELPKWDWSWRIFECNCNCRKFERLPNSSDRLTVSWTQGQRWQKEPDGTRFGKCRTSVGELGESWGIWVYRRTESARSELGTQLWEISRQRLEWKTDAFRLLDEMRHRNQFDDPVIHCDTTWVQIEKNCDIMWNHVKSKVKIFKYKIVFLRTSVNHKYQTLPMPSPERRATTHTCAVAEMEKHW